MGPTRLAGIILLLATGSARAGPFMGTSANTMARGVFAAGGSSATTALNGLVLTVGEGVVFSTGATAANKTRGGFETIVSFPGSLNALNPRADVTVSSVTLLWSAPAYDGGVGTLQPGSSYIIQTASYTSPTIFGDIATFNTQVATKSVTPGLGVGAGAAGLIANTTYWAAVWTVDNDANVSAAFMSTFTTLATTPTFTAGKVFFQIYPASYTTSVATVAVAWNALPQSPPDASSKTCEGYVIAASSDDFGAIVLPTPAPVFSSVTYSVLASTLTLGTTAPMDLSATYYFKLGTLNWAGQVNYTTYTFTLNFSIQQSTGMLHLGAIDPGVTRSSVSISSMVVYNTGNWPVTIALTASTATIGGSPWALYVTPGIEQATLEGVWNSGATGPPASAFSTFLTTSTLLSQSAGNFVGNQNGYQIPPGQSRTLWFYFTMPNSSVSLGPETFRVTPWPMYP